MILQSKGGCYLTEAADVKIEERHFVNTVLITSAEEVAKWREVTEAEKEAMLRQGTVLDVSQLSAAYLDEVDELLSEIPAQINKVSLTPAEALAHKKYYPEWGDENAPMGKQVEPGFRMTYGEDLYEVIQAHALQADWVPGAGTESLYKVVNVEHEGTQDDPIPYNGNMELENGKYYTQDGKTYLCNRDTGQPVYHTLAELIGLYVEEVENENPAEDVPEDTTEGAAEETTEEVTE